VISGNHIDVQSTGIDIQNGGIIASGNTIHQTATGTYGCVLIEGSDHSDVIDGLECYGQSGILGYSAVLIGDEGSQTGQNAIINNVRGKYLQSGINIFNTANDQPQVGLVSWENVTTPYPGGGVNVVYRCGTSGVVYSGTSAPSGCGTSVDTGLVSR
jgi:hypothetical protein